MTAAAYQSEPSSCHTADGALAGAFPGGMLQAAEAATSGLWSYDEDRGELTLAGELAEVVSAAGEPCGLEDWLTSVHPDDAEALRFAIFRCASTGAPVDVSLRLRLSQGDYRWRLARGARFADADGQGVCVAGAVFDTQRERVATDQALERMRLTLQRQRMQAVDCLAGGIAHEFNNALQVVSGYITFAQQMVAPDCQVYDDLAQAAIATDRATKLTRDLLEFTRADNGSASSISVRDTVEGLGGLLGPIVGCDVDLEISPICESLKVAVGGAEFRHALLNLCLNARDAMPVGGSLWMTAEAFGVPGERGLTLGGLKPGRYCRVTLSDTGHGIPSDFVGRVFDPYFTTKEHAQDAGMGLAVVQAFAVRAGGHITVHSDGIGAGATFTIYLPLVDKERDRPLAPTEVLQGLTVLSIAEGAGPCDGARPLLESAGCRVVAIDRSHPSAAAEEAARQKADIVLLAPSPYNTEWIAAYRESEASPPLVVGCGCTLNSDRGKSLAALADDVLRSPYDETALISSVKRLVNAPA